MARAIKYAVMYRAQGAEMIMPLVLSLGGFSPTDEQDALYGLDYGYRGPAPKTAAFLMTCYWLNGAQFEGCEHIGTLWKFHWMRSGRSMTFTWSEERRTNPFADRLARCTDVFGNTVISNEITDMPVIVW